MTSLLAYIGPGPGFAVQAPALALLSGLLIAALTLLTFPLRLWLRRPKPRRATPIDRVVVLGLDGLEPTLAERWMESGQLPHLHGLRERGSYQHLATTCPPLSPVAWSSFATAVNPGKHGIFGFLQRTRDFRPFLAFSQVEKVRWRLGRWSLPWWRFRPKSLRKSKSFWTVLGEHGVFSHVLRVPVTWPAETFHGAMLSAMGVPDLRGSQGTYTLFSTQPESLISGECIVWRRVDEEYRATVAVAGLGEVRLRLRQRTLRWQGQRQELELGSYTPWLSLQLGRAHGIVRFLLLAQDPPRLYMTPLHIDPRRPSLPISYPTYYAAALANLLGPYATCGLAEDTGGREDGVISHEQFLQQSYDIHAEREAQFFHALKRTRRGLCLTVFDATDRIQHMAINNEAALLELYTRMDALVGRVLAQLGPHDVLMVMSDHGFKPVRRVIDLNAWLVEAGYLVVREGSIVWPETRAYALGLAGLHLNLVGRDARGCVAAGEIVPLKQELRSALEGLVDPQSGEQAISRVFDSHSAYSGPYLASAPDLVVGYSPGYRICKAAARGEVGSRVWQDNDSPWCGDHCLDPSAVPGVLFCSQVLADQADIRDVGPTILNWFGVTPPAYMEGTCLNQD